MNAAPLVDFPDFARMTDQQRQLLVLYEIAELKAELRALSGLLLQVHDKKPENFNKVVDQCQDQAIREMIEHATALMRKPTGMG